MRGSWRERRIGSWFSRLWRPWVSLHPFRGRGRTINEPKLVGIRDLMASPDEVKARPQRRWLVIGGFFFILLVALIVARGEVYIGSVDANRNLLRREGVAPNVPSIFYQWLPGATINPIFGPLLVWIIRHGAR